MHAVNGQLSLFGKQPCTCVPCAPQALSDLRPLHRALLHFEDEEKLLVLLASMTAKYLAKHEDSLLASTTFRK